METKSKLSLFKEQLNRTISDLDKWVNDPEMEKVKLKIFTALKINIRGSVEMFMDHITPYVSEILDGNETFFINLNIDEEMKNVGANDSEMSDELQRIRERIKTHWNSLNKKQRTSLKNNFKLLVMLGAIATRNEKIRLEINKRRNINNPLVFN